MGLPGKSNGNAPGCGTVPGETPCSKEDILRDISKSQALYLPFTTPAYSNVAYALLGMILEAATGKPFVDTIQSGIYDPVGMNSSFFDGPTKAFSLMGFVPKQDVSWNVTHGAFER